MRKHCPISSRILENFEALSVFSLFNGRRELSEPDNRFERFSRKSASLTSNDSVPNFLNFFSLYPKEKNPFSSLGVTVNGNGEETANEVSRCFDADK